VTRRRQQRDEDATAEWLRREVARRRRAVLTSQQQHRDGVARLARAGLRPVALPSLDAALDELNPPCL
jgi:hypothetical protein